MKLIPIYFFLEIRVYMRPGDYRLPKTKRDQLLCHPKVFRLKNIQTKYEHCILHRSKVKLKGRIQVCEEA